MSKKVIFRVTYDIEQLGGGLLWSASSESGQSLVADTGRYAGSVHFEHDDQIHVEVRGSGPLGKFVEARVLAAHFITLPHNEGMRTSAPAPFSDETAVVAIPGWGKVQVRDDAVGALRYSEQTSKTPLPVIQKTGRWKLSMLLSVAIVRNVDGAVVETVRVFGFDPESEVGTGMDPT